MNKKIVLYSVVIGAPLSVKMAKAQDIQEYYEQTHCLSENLDTTKADYAHDSHHDELDTICEQLDCDDVQTFSSPVTDWAIALALTTIMHYYSLKEYLANSWHSVKEKIARK